MKQDGFQESEFDQGELKDTEGQGFWMKSDLLRAFGDLSGTDAAIINLIGELLSKLEGITASMNGKYFCCHCQITFDRDAIESHSKGGKHVREGSRQKSCIFKDLFQNR